MNKYLLRVNCNFYKANLHSHTNWSDGYISPEEMKKVYKDNGYSIISFTDHNGLFSHNELDEDDFLTIPGFEIDLNRTHGTDYADCETAHFCCYPRHRENFTQPGLDVNYRVPKMRWSVENYPKYIRYTEIDNLEVYNHGSFVAGWDEHCGHVYDDFLREGKMIKFLSRNSLRQAVTFSVE